MFGRIFASLRLIIDNDHLPVEILKLREAAAYKRYAEAHAKTPIVPPMDDPAVKALHRAWRFAFEALDRAERAINR